MRAQNIVSLIATRSALNASVAACYVVAVVILVYAIMLHVRLASSAERAATAGASPGATRIEAHDACGDASGLDRGICKADAKLDAARAKIRRHLAKRRLQDIHAESGSVKAIQPPDLTLFFAGDTLEWMSERGVAQRSRNLSVDSATLSHGENSGSAAPRTSLGQSTLTGH